ncbi:hypothetical protein D3C87_2130550 [compost metagenome]
MGAPDEKIVIFFIQHQHVGTACGVSVFPVLALVPSRMATEYQAHEMVKGNGSAGAGCYSFDGKGSRIAAE